MYARLVPVRLVTSCYVQPRQQHQKHHIWSSCPCGIGNITHRYPLTKADRPLGGPSLRASSFWIGALSTQSADACFWEHLLESCPPLGYRLYEGHDKRFSSAQAGYMEAVLTFSAWESDDKWTASEDVGSEVHTRIINNSFAQHCVPHTFSCSSS